MVRHVSADGSVVRVARRRRRWGSSVVMMLTIVGPDRVVVSG
jgi:hypothetical protein